MAALSQPSSILENLHKVISDAIVPLSATADYIHATTNYSALRDNLANYREKIFTEFAIVNTTWRAAIPALLEQDLDPAELKIVPEIIDPTDLRDALDAFIYGLGYLLRHDPGLTSFQEYVIEPRRNAVKELTNIQTGIERWARQIAKAQAKLLVPEENS